MRLLAVFFMLMVANPSAMARAVSDEEAVRACAFDPDIQINVIPLFDEPTLDLSQSLASLQELAHDRRHAIHESLTMGLTRYEPTLQFEVPIKGVKFPDGFACAHVDHVNVTIGYKDVVVFIASEIREGTCGFDEVMGHEQKHIAVNRAVLNAYIPLIVNRLHDYLLNHGVFNEANPDRAVARLNDEMHDILTSTANEMNADNQARQSQVDTAAEYNRVSASCGGQLQNIVRHFQRSSP